MEVVPLLEEVDGLIAALEAGDDARDACERILFLLDDDPTAESTSLPSVSLGEPSVEEATWVAGEGTAGTAGTWGADGLGSTVGTWAPERVETKAPKGLRDVCTGLLGYTLAPPDALVALRAWREVRRPAARYVLGGPLGRGGMGEVLSAHDVALDRDIALKVLLRGSPAARRRFVGEAKLTARLDHPGIVPVHDVGETPDGRPYFAMKKVRGRSLRQVLDAGGLTGLRARLDLFRRVGETVAFAHDRGVLHLDLKPDNIMIGAFGEVLLMDWGLAQAMEAGGARVRHVAGTPRYMAPEQAVPDARVDARTDLYSLCVVLYELLCDRPAFPGTDRTTLLDDVRQGRFVAPRAHDPTVPRELDALVRRGMALAPDERLPDVLTLLAEVEAFLEDRPMATVAYTLRQRARMWARRNRSSVQGAGLAAAVGAVALLGATGVYVRQVEAARVEAEAQRWAAEGAERRALAEVVRTQQTLGEARLRDHRYLQARSAYAESIDLLKRLRRSPAPGELGWREATYHQQLTRRTDLAAPTEALVTYDGAFYGVSGEASWRLPVEGDVVESLGAWGRPVAFGGLLRFLADAGDEVVVRDAHGATWLRRPYARWAVSGGDLYDLDAPRWTSLTDGTETTGGAALCDGVTEVVGHFYGCRHSRNSFDNTWVHRSGEGTAPFALAADASGDGRLYWDPAHVQPMVIDRDGVQRWSTDEGGAFAVTSVDGGRAVAWVVEDGRVLVRDWATSALRAAFERPADACLGPLAWDAERGMVAIACDDHLERLAPFHHPWNGRVTTARHAVAVTWSSGVVALATPEGIQVVGPQGRSRTVLPLDDVEQVRDLAFSGSGRLAVVAKTGVWVVSPDGGVVEVPFEGVPLGGAWRHDPAAAADEVLGVIGSQGVLMTWHAGEVHQWRIPGWEERTWGIAPASEGWFLSDYKGDQRVVRVVEGEVVAGASVGLRDQAYDVAVRQGTALVGAADGAWLWDGEHDAVHLPGPLSVAVAWAPTGPVVAGNDNRLRFYDDEGTLLHSWALPFLVSSLAGSAEQLVAVATGRERARLEVVPLPLGSTGLDPSVERWAVAGPAD